jgi:hypothetical protein
MKGAIFFLLWTLLAASLFTHAQNWSVLNKNYKYNFSLSNPDQIECTIYADSFQVNGIDTTFFLNRIITACDTCSTPDLFLKNQPQFLQRQVLFANGDYHFSDTFDFIIKPNAQLNLSWEFDPVSHDTAIISEVYLGQLFGQSDSMKLITFGSGDTIIISKNFGIVQFPDYASNDTYSLIGVEGPDIGLLEPTFKDIFNFNVGDIFQYNRSSQADAWAPSIEEDKKVTIIDKQVYPDSFVYQVDIYKKNYHVDYVTYNEHYSHYSSEWVFIDSANHICNKKQGEAQQPLDLSLCNIDEPDSIVFGRVGTPLDHINWYCCVETGVTKGIWSDAGIMTEGYNVFNLPNPGLNSHPDLLEGTALNAVCADLFAPQLGRVFSMCNGFCSEFDMLIGYVKNNDTIETVYPDEYYILNMEVKPERNSGISIFPNPVSEQATIFLKNSNQLIEGVKLYNISGQIVRQENSIFSNSFIIKKDNLESGCYILKVRDQAGTIFISKLLL